VIFTGSGIWSRSPGIDSTTSVGAGTIAYVNGGFSTDFTVNGNWTRSSLAASGITASSGVSYSPNVQYKFELADAWFVEPTVGVSCTQTFNADFGAQTGDSTEAHGGVRVGTETVWNGVRVQPSISGAPFSIVSQTGGGGQIGPGGNPIPGAGGVATGQVGGRGSGKLNFLWTETFSSYVEAHGSGIAGTTAYGAMGGVRWTF
jgi:Autotransporter beta-domain